MSIAIPRPRLVVPARQAFGSLHTPFIGVFIGLLSILPADARVTDVEVIRLPDGAVQPQAAIDDEGVIHVVYLTGDPMAADVQYAHTTAGGLRLGDPARVNAQPGSAIAVGTIRGPHMALGKRGRVHVAWMGSGKSSPKAPGKQAPMLYTRLGNDGSFEPERNVITKYVGLDGGGSVAADPNGNVYVAWHAPDQKGGDEGTRRVFVARSSDDGATFDPEQPLTGPRLGACACCGMRLMAPPGGAVVGLFRTATDQIHRDTRAFLFQGSFDRRWGGTLDPMESATCVMSTYALANLPGHQRFIGAWETDGRIRFASYSYRSVSDQPVRDLPGAADHGRDAPGQKHPSIAVGEDGSVLIAWAEGTGWERGGAVAWQLFDPEMRPVPRSAGRADGLPAWSLPAAVALKGGGFAVLY